MFVYLFRFLVVLQTKLASRLLMDFYLVEAAGVEPASASYQLLVLHA